MRPHRRQPTRLHRPWDSPGKNTGVGCHFLLQCMKVKSESEVAQSCQTLSDPMDCSLPASSVHGIFQAGILEWGAMAFSLFLVLELAPAWLIQTLPNSCCDTFGNFGLLCHKEISEVCSVLVVIWWVFGGAGGWSRGKRTLIYTVCQLLWCKYSYCASFKWPRWNHWIQSSKENCSQFGMPIGAGSRMALQGN